MIGTRLGNWIIDAELGQGGMGDVYRAHEASTDGPPRLAAVKLLAAGLAQDPGFVARFQREIDILRQLDHPHIVRLYESGQHDGRSYYVMEYVDGKNFEEILLEQTRLPWSEVLDLALQVCPALKHAHDRGIIHRDIKPSNLLRARDGGAVKLTDFGIARAFAATHLTATGGVVGTAEYLSPEQAVGKPAGKRSDLYSLGVVLYALLVGRPPFQGESPVELLHKHRFGQFERPVRLVPEIPHELDEVVCKLLEKDPAQRPPDAGVLHRQLDGLRRRLEYKVRQTGAGVAGTETGEAVAPERREGPATLMSRLMRQELEKEKHGGPVRRFFNRPLILLALFLLTLGLIVWGLWPTSAETLYQRGAAAMHAEPPDDDTAEAYFDRLMSRYPDNPHGEEVARLRREIEDHRAQAEAERRARHPRPMSEAEWFYEEGLRLRQRGETAAAERLWRDVVWSFHDVPSEQPWVRRSEEQLAKPDEHVLPEEERWAPVRRALREARDLRDQGKRAEAEAVWQGLEELYGKDPSAAPVLEELRRDRGR